MDSTEIMKSPHREERTAGEERTRTRATSVNSSSRRRARVRLLSPSRSLASTFFAELTLPLARTEYAQVIKMLGNGRVEAMCFDGEKRLGHIRGKMRKKASLHSADHAAAAATDSGNARRSGSTRATLSSSRSETSRTARPT